MDTQASDKQLMEDFFGAGEYAEPELLDYDDTEQDEEHNPFLPTPIAHRPSNRWDPRLVADIALELDPPEELCQRYGLTEEELNHLLDNPLFRRELAITMRSLREEGLPFQKKAALQAETYLQVLDDLVHSPLTEAKTKLECIRSAVKWGKLEPTENKGDGPSGGNTVNVQINF